MSSLTVRFGRKDIGSLSFCRRYSCAFVHFIMHVHSIRFCSLRWGSRKPVLCNSLHDAHPIATLRSLSFLWRMESAMPVRERGPQSVVHARSLLSSVSLRLLGVEMD
ncbi:hypothetical protein TRVL_07276 [Trypanosoma vivax]|nr:hypothetical protein TRVL_07276 [Trypanosoma vivax]